MAKAGMARRQARSRRPLRFWVYKAVQYGVLILFALICIVPLFWIAATSLKTVNEVAMDPLGPPPHPHWENYVTAWVQGRFGKYLRNSIYVSLNNIFITYTTGYITNVRGYDEWIPSTVVHKISVADGQIEYKGQGEVPGQVLNQFSMDEYDGYFRVATTSGDVWGSSPQNNVYVLDGGLNIVGRLEGLAPGERIYSARFMGDRVYLVTFVRVDPLFVIDLADPTSPRVLGELKIPGYSDYLHPYDETHVIGLGKESTETNESGFALYEGVKLALFDVSDPANPVEVSKYTIGDRGTDSFALYDHRAFLFSREKNLLVIPISLVEGEQWTWQGAYVFDLTLESGFVLKGKVAHSDFASPETAWDYTNMVSRSLYIGDVLYTISEGQVKMNGLADLAEINSVLM